MKTLLTFLLILVLIGCQTKIDPSFERMEFDDALQNGISANKGFDKSLNFVKGWLKHRDPESGLIPRNLHADSTIWNAQDAAADNYPFMVLTTSIVDSSLFHKEMLDMLHSETRLSSRLHSLPDTYSFIENDFVSEQADTGKIIFGTSEYMKDGLMPLTEWLGNSPWMKRMESMLKDLYPLRAGINQIKGEYLGNAPVDEVNGELLQVLSRFYWITGDKMYLEWAEEIGDYYLLENNLPTEYIRIRDHGCEFISGLSELYYAVSEINPEKKRLYQAPFHRFLDNILKVGRNDDGLFYNAINLNSEKIVDQDLADTWGYTLNAYYTVYQIDSIEKYKDAVLKLMKNIHKYSNYPWEGESSDGYADAIESAINLYNRENIASVADWIDSEIEIMWQKQQPDGIIEGWHGDGNFARTSIMYALWKTKGTTIHPWQNSIKMGAINKGDTLMLTLSSSNPYHGKIIFDTPRHQEFMNLALDYPRINQFPEWYTITKTDRVNIFQSDGTNHKDVSLAKGLKVHLDQEDTLKIYVVKLPPVPMKN